MGGGSRMARRATPSRTATPASSLTSLATDARTATTSTSGTTRDPPPPSGGSATPKLLARKPGLDGGVPLVDVVSGGVPHCGYLLTRPGVTTGFFKVKHGLDVWQIERAVINGVPRLPAGSGATILVDRARARAWLCVRL